MVDRTPRHSGRPHILARLIARIYETLFFAITASILLSEKPWMMVPSMSMVGTPARPPDFRGIGVSLGAAASYGILAGIKAVLPRYAFAPEVVIRINLRVLLFSVGVGIATALLFGVWPALQLSRTRAGQALAATQRRVMGSVRSRRVHNALIAVQIALTMVLLAGAGAAARGFLQMMHIPLGYDPHYVMSVGIPVHANTYTTWQSRGTYFEQLRAKVAEIPGVWMAAISTNATPLLGAISK